MTSTTFFFVFIPILAVILLAVNLIFAPHNPYQEKDSAFECGFHSFLGQNRTQFSISFFIFALLFLLFDLEILLVYPYVVSAYTNGIYGLVIMLIFFLALTLGFAFELGKNALKIDSRQVLTIVKYNNTYLLGNVSSIFSLSKLKKFCSAIAHNITFARFLFSSFIICMLCLFRWYLSGQFLTDPNNLLTNILLGHSALLAHIGFFSIFSDYLDSVGFNFTLYELLFGVRQPSVDVGINKHNILYKNTSGPSEGINPSEGNGEEVPNEEFENSDDNPEEVPNEELENSEDNPEEVSDDDFEVNSDIDSEGDPGYDSDVSGAANERNMSPVPDTPTNEEELENMREYISNRKMDLESEDQRDESQKTLDAMLKPESELTEEDKILIEEENKNNVFNKSKEELINDLRGSILYDSKLAEIARSQLEEAEDKLRRSGFDDQDSNFDDSNPLPTTSEENRLEENIPEGNRSEENLPEDSGRELDTFGDIYNATPQGSPRVPSNLETTSSNVPEVEASDSISRNPETSESNNLELEKERETESTHKRKRDSDSDIDERETESTHKRKRNSDSDIDEKETESTHKRKRDSDSDIDEKEAEFTHKRKRDSGSDIDERPSKRKR